MGRSESKGADRGVWGGVAAGLQCSLGASYPPGLRRPPALPPPEASVAAAAVSASFCSSCSSSPQNRMFSAAEASWLPKPQLPSGAHWLESFPLVEALHGTSCLLPEPPASPCKAKSVILGSP